jgi:hypothetical protein
MMCTAIAPRRREPEDEPRDRSCVYLPRDMTDDPVFRLRATYLSDLPRIAPSGYLAFASGRSFPSRLRGSGGFGTPLPKSRPCRPFGLRHTR